MKTSAVWYHFTEINKKSVLCNVCKNQYKYYGNTTNLKEHLRRLHPNLLFKGRVVPYSTTDDSNMEARPEQEITLNEHVELIDSMIIKEESCDLQASSSDGGVDSSVDKDIFENSYESKRRTYQCSTELAVASPTAPPISKRKRHADPDALTGTNNLTQDSLDEIDRSLVKFIVKDHHPIFIVEDEGFKEFVYKLNPEYALPLKKTIKNNLMRKYYVEIHAAIVEKLNSVDYVSITIDHWTSNTEKAYVSVTACFIHNWCLYSTMLAVCEVDNPYNSENISAVVRNVLREFNIFNKIVTVITDNTEYIKNVIIDKLEQSHYCCVANTVNLVATTSINSILDLDNILFKCRNLVTYFKNNNLPCEILYQKQEEMGYTTLKLKQQVPDRWNSIYVMLERLLAVKQPISVVSNELKNNFLPKNLSNTEWSIIEDCMPLLKVVLKITEELSGDKCITMSKILPLISGLQYNLKMIDTSTPISDQLKKNLLELVQSKLGSLESNETVAKATFLDPRFKKVGFGVEENATKAQEYVTKELINLMSNKYEPIKPTPQHKYTQFYENDLWSHFDQKIANESICKDKTLPAVQMIKNYIGVKLLPRQEDPFKFWKDHELFFPDLAILARKYLSIPATCVDSERLFTKSGCILNDRRSRLDSKCLNEMLFLGSNM